MWAERPEKPLGGDRGSELIPFCRETRTYVNLYCLWKNAECTPPAGGRAAMCCVT